MRHAGGVPVLALPSRFGVGPIFPCLPGQDNLQNSVHRKAQYLRLGAPLQTCTTLGTVLVQLEIVGDLNLPNGMHLMGGRPGLVGNPAPASS